MTQRHSGLTVPSTDYGRAIVQDLAVLALVTAVALAGAVDRIGGAFFLSRVFGPAELA